jgi:O-antigen ligase
VWEWLTVLAYIFSWLFVFIVPWENVVIFPGVGTIGKVAGIAAFGVTAVRVLLTARVRKLASYHWVAFAYLCWVVLSAFWAVNIYCSPVFGCPVRNQINNYLQVFAMVWVLWEATPTRSRLINLFQAYVLGAYVAAGNTVYQYAVGAALKHAYGRYAAENFDPNSLGMELALALPMAWYLGSTSSSGFQRWLNRSYFVAGTVAILLTGSRGAMLATVVALSVVPWTLTQVRRGVRVAAVVSMLVAGVLAIRFVPAELFKRLSTTSSEISEGTMNGRLEIWKAGIEAVPARPLQGYGPAGWQMAISHRLGLPGPHNTFLSILVDEGLIGLFLYLTIYVLLLRRLLRLPNVFERRVSLTILATLVIAITPLGWDTVKAAWLTLGFLMACSELLGRTHGAQQPDAAGAVRYAPASRRRVPSARRPI